jgi:hypothetical protein
MGKTIAIPPSHIVVVGAIGRCYSLQGFNQVADRSGLEFDGRNRSGRSWHEYRQLALRRSDRAQPPSDFVGEIINVAVSLTRELELVADNIHAPSITVRRDIAPTFALRSAVSVRALQARSAFW